MFLLILPVLGKSQAPKVSEGGRIAYRHAYYLFLSDTPHGCEECYIPLLVSSEPLQQIASAPAEKTRCVLITTYERDSIWHEDGLVVVAAGDVEAAPRMIELRGRKYRYQEINADEALKLFMKPMGTIPISRPMLPGAEVPGPTLDDLIADFRSVKQTFVP
jgi:hypothetical protein